MIIFQIVSSLLYPDISVLVTLPKNMLAEMPRSQPSFIMIKMEMFVRSGLRQSARALKKMLKTVNGQKQNGKGHISFPIGVAD